MTFLLNGVQALQHQWKMCVNLVENKLHLVIFYEGILVRLWTFSWSLHIRIYVRIYVHIKAYWKVLGLTKKKITWNHEISMLILHIFQKFGTNGKSVFAILTIKKNNEKQKKNQNKKRYRLKRKKVEPRTFHCPPPTRVSSVEAFMGVYKCAGMYACVCVWLWHKHRVK